MRLSQAIQQVFSVPAKQCSPKDIEKVLATLRVTLGMTYQQSYEIVKKQFPQLTLSQFEEYCLQAEDRI